jgi:sulfur-oxidizing protein SoxZ
MMMATGIKVRVKLKGNIAEVKSLMKHPMETGARKDPGTSDLVPLHHIRQISFVNNGTPVLLVNCSTAVAKDPYFTFRFRNAQAGDKFTVNWVDTRGKTDSIETILA